MMYWIRRVWHNLPALLLLIRFSALSFSIILPLLGAAVVSSRLKSYQVIALIGVAIAFHIFAYVLNDVIDLPVDRTEPLRRDFPLVRGTIQPRHALVIALAQIPAALILTACLGGTIQTYAVLIAAFVLMTAYNMWGKHTAFPPLTDFIQALSWGAMVLYGATVVPGRSPGLVGVIFAFVVIFILMINGVHGSLRDLANDLNCHVRTTAILLGARPLGSGGVGLPRRFQLYTLTLQALLIGIILVPFACNWFGYPSITWHITFGVALLFTFISIILLVVCALSTADHTRMVFAGTIHIVVSLSTLLLAFTPYLGATLSIVILLVYMMPLCSILWDWLAKGSMPDRRFRLLNQLTGLIQISHPDISLLAALYTFLGSYLSGDLLTLRSPVVIRAAIVVGLIVSFSFVINDYRDVLADSLNNPRRPIPSGRISRRFAAILALVIALTALGIALSLGPVLAGIAVFNTSISTLYSYFLKKTVLLGNMAIALLDASIILYGSLATGIVPTVVWVAFALTFLYIIAQEILYTIRDQKGDALAGLPTTTIRLGAEVALQLFRFFALGFVVAALLVGVLGLAPVRYLYAAIPCSVLPMLVVVMLLSKRPTTHAVKLGLRIINIGWVLSILPVVLLK